MLIFYSLYGITAEKQTNNTTKGKNDLKIKRSTQKNDKRKALREIRISRCTGRGDFGYFINNIPKSPPAIRRHDSTMTHDTKLITCWCSGWMIRNKTKYTKLFTIRTFVKHIQTVFFTLQQILLRGLTTRCWILLSG